MNWKLIFQLSLFGLAMGIATVFLIPSSIEPAFWLVIFIICATIIARQCTGKYFLHGLLVSVANSVWITSAHILFFQTYIANHPQEASMMNDMPMPESPRLMMLLLGPVFGIIFGLVLGFFSFIAAKVIRKN